MIHGFALVPNNYLHYASIRYRLNAEEHKYIKSSAIILLYHIIRERRNVRLVSIYKRYSIATLGLALCVKMLGISISYDFTDFPFQSIHDFQNVKTLWKCFLFSVLVSIVDECVVPTHEVGLSIGRNYVYREDNSAADLSGYYQAKDSIGFIDQDNILEVVWIGNKGKRIANSGVYELLRAKDEIHKAVDWLNTLQTSLKITICTASDLDVRNCINNTLSKDGLMINIVDWSINSQSSLLTNKLIFYYPTHNSISSFYKSANRIKLSLLHDSYVIAGFRSSHTRIESSRLYIGHLEEGLRRLL